MVQKYRSGLDAPVNNANCPVVASSRDSEFNPGGMIARITEKKSSAIVKIIWKPLS